MTDDLDDFWATWIAITPEEDHAYRGCCGPMLLVAVLLVIILAWLALTRL